VRKRKSVRKQKAERDSKKDSAINLSFSLTPRRLHVNDHVIGTCSVARSQDLCQRSQPPEVMPVQ